MTNSSRRPPRELQFQASSPRAAPSVRVVWVDKTKLKGQALAEMPKSPRSPPGPVRARPPRVIEVLAYPSVQLLDVTGPLQVFASANDLVAQARGAPPYVLRVVAKGRQGVVTASAGLAIATSPLPRVRTALDTLIGAGGRPEMRGPSGGAGASKPLPPTRRWLTGCGSVPRTHVASPNSAPERSCSVLQARSMDGARRPIGR